MTGLIIATAVATVASAATAVTTGVMGYQQQQSNADAAEAAAKARKRQAEYNAEIQKQNQKIANRNADAMREEALEQTRRQRKENERMLSRQRAQLGTSGALMEGTPLAVMGESAANLELDAMDTWRQGKLRERQERTKGYNFGLQADLDSFAGLVDYNTGKSQASLMRQAGRNSMASGFMNAGNSLLSGTASMVRSIY